MGDEAHFRGSAFPYLGWLEIPFRFQVLTSELVSLVNILRRVRERKVKRRETKKEKKMRRKLKRKMRRKERGEYRGGRDSDGRKGI